MVTTFPSIRLGLMVGIGGGVPSPNDIRLGDVVVSESSGATAGVVQYDFGKEEEEGFRRQGQLNSPSAVFLSAITAFKARDRESFMIKTVMRASSKIQKTHLNLKREPAYTYQGAKNDRLFQSWYNGPSASQWPIISSLIQSLQGPEPAHRDCASCDPRMLVKRNARDLPGIPRIHYGLIASGNRVIKNARMRDKIVARLKQDTNSGDCLCFEMEAAGLMNNFPCLVIRGISDYADAHKNDVWHNYAALTAAAYARELIRVLSTAEVSSSKPAREIIGQIQQDVKIISSNVQKISDEDFKKDFRKWLKPSEQQTNFDQAQDEIRHYQTESTWLFKHEDYGDWSSHKIHHIWLHGQSGCGKTVLASTVIKQLSAEGNLCLYFFFDFRDTEKQSLESLLRSLIWQFFTRSDSKSVKTLVRQLYEESKSPTPTIEKLKDMFDMIVEEMDEVQVVLDALDESTKKSTDRDELLRWLKPRTQHEGPGVCKLRTIITSRSDQQDIVNALGSQCPGRRKIRIENESAKVKANVHQYIRNRLSNDGGFAEWRNNPHKSPTFGSEPHEQGDMERWHPIMKEMEKCLVGKASLMFRWASLTIDSLGEMGTIQKIERALESLPNGLDEIYTRSLDEVKLHRSYAIRILQFLLFSPEPLRVSDILHIISVNLEASPGCEIDPTRRMNSFDKLSSLMSTFIRITGDAKVQFAHSSARDYLLNRGPENPQRYWFREAPAKAAVVGVCLGYIDSFLTHATSFDLEFLHATWLPRANSIWWALAHEEEHQNQTRTTTTSQTVAPNHGSSPQEGSVQQEAYSFILKFLVHNGHQLQHRTSVYLNEQYGGPPLYVASAIGLTRIVGKLLSDGVRADEREGFGGFAEASALPHSFYKNTLDHLGVKEQEEMKPGNYSVKGYGNALVAACYQGHNSIVQMLLDRKADVNRDDGTSYGSPLYAGCHEGHKAVVEMLLKKDADVNQSGKLSGYPLSAACWSNSLEIVKLLLDKGVDVNLGNPLFTTCWSGNLEIMKLLLDKGANVNAQEDQGETSLSVACSRGHESSVRELLAEGADANAGGGDYGYPLQAACSLYDREPEAMVKMLLEHGAKVNARGGMFGTALHAAVERSHSRSIDLLLTAGADIHIEAGKRGTILEAACFSKCKETFQLLLGAEIKPNSPSSGRSKILHLAALTKQPYIVRYLLEAGANLADLDEFSNWERDFVFRVAQESCNEVILQSLGIRKRLKGSIHHED